MLKPGYKQTDLGALPQEWEVVPIGQIVRFEGGSQPPKSVFAAENKPDYVRLIQIRDYKTDDFATYVPINLVRKTCSKADVMIGRYGPPVFQILRGLEGAYNVALIKSIPSTKINSDYWYYTVSQEALFTFIDTLSRRSSGQTGVDMLALRNYQIPLPPLAEQRAIADTLGAVDALLHGQRALLAKKRGLQQATQQALLTRARRLPGFAGEWEERTLGRLFSFLSTGNNSRSELTTHGEVGYLHYGDIHTKFNDFLDCQKAELPFLPKEKARGLTFLQDGDLIMSDASEDYEGVGKSVEIVGVGSQKIVAGLHTHLLRSDKKVVVDGFKGYIPLMKKTRAFLQQMATGVTVYGISKGNIKDTPVELPPPAEQQAITAVLTALDAELAALAAELAKTEALKQGLMQDLLTGAIRLRG